MWSVKNSTPPESPIDQPLHPAAGCGAEFKMWTPKIRRISQLRHIRILKRTSHDASEFYFYRLGGWRAFCWRGKQHEWRILSYFLGV
ncbi:hypothetical protein CDAR_314431 [Caerostris darwini]|uniref:Uncharacterized protein n=1 Tax=Caerostris darwini TaxID=1538125 RepID=A0AAV4TS48_9ARAC|nr:hypothetical protein CDAR_314431 [Caerostris darwini]